MKTILQRSPRQVGTGRDDPTLSPNCQVTWSQKKKKHPHTKAFSATATPRPSPPQTPSGSTGMGRAQRKLLWARVAPRAPRASIC